VSILGLDVGDRRIGLALAEEGGTLAVPIGAFERTSLRNDLPRITEVLRERKATLLVAGLPISINGTLGPQAKKTQKFLDILKEQTQLPVEMVDERYSSSEAGRLMQARGAQPSRRRADVDATAATIILQAYLDQQAQRIQSTHSVAGA
jgi:putative Holliday junction resolvase